MSLETSSKVALITGAARRVGAATARHLHQRGMNVIVHYRNSKQEAENLVNELNALRSSSAVALQADLTQIQKLDTLIVNANECFGRLDVLVNNASEFYPTPIGTATEMQWNDLIDSNLKAPFFLAQAAIPFLTKVNGCIVNIVDIHSERPKKEYSVYCIAKAGLALMTKALAKELGSKMRVNGVSPGTVAWPEGKNAVDQEMKQKIIDNTLLKRSGAPEDIAKAVYFLINDANYITGQIISVDGGRLLS